MSEKIEREFGWDDEIENDGGEFVLLEPGEYEFWIEDFERKRFGGSSKLPPCNQAVLTVKIMSPQGVECTIKHNLFLHSKVEGLLCSFFTSIGQRKHGEKLKMDWSKVRQASGFCKVGLREYTDNNGVVRQANQIEKFLEPTEAPKREWQRGSF